MKSTEQKILDAALKLFSKHGLHDTSLREIAELADVNPSAINYHFVSKENLYKQVIINFGSEQIQWGLDTLGGENPTSKTKEEFKTKIETLTNYIVKLIFKEADMYNIFVRELMEGMPFAKNEFMDLVPTMIKRIAVFIENSKAHGFIRNDIDSFFSAYTYIIMIMTPFERKEYLKELDILNLFNTKKRTSYIDHSLDFFYKSVLI